MAEGYRVLGPLGQEIPPIPEGFVCVVCRTPTGAPTCPGCVTNTQDDHYDRGIDARLEDLVEAEILIEEAKAAAERVRVLFDQ